jgi:serine/threonine protein phosphatase 1
MTRPTYAVADIHGFSDQLDRALDLIATDGGTGAEIVFLGDLVDRGPDSRGVIDRLLEGRTQGRPWQVVQGNHDAMFARFLRDGAVTDERIKSGLPWTDPRLGGAATLASYGVSVPPDADLAVVRTAALGAVPAEHRHFLDTLPLSIQRQKLLFVHAGIRPGVALADQDAADLIWIRDPFLDHRDPHPWLVVHGHTALKFPEHAGNRVNLDGGTGWGRTLHPAVFEGRDCWLLTDKGRVPLTP